jgi:hypothetical protein
MPLTDANVKAVKPIGKPIKRFDGGGLYLHVTPKGSKLWRLAYRFEGRPRTASFGIYTRHSRC